MIRGLHHIAILCSDREASLRFYTALGFALYESHVRPERNDEILMLHGHGITLELFVSEGNPTRPTGPEAYGLRHLALAVDALEEVLRTLTDAGYAPEPIRRDTFTGERMTFVKDPDGLPIELHE